MKKSIISFVLITVLSCTNEITTKEGEMVPLLAPSAKLEPFDDGSGMVKVTTYGSDNGILEQGYYLDGYREGVYTKFHANGFVDVVTGYVMGKKQGLSVVADDKGQILERFTYHNDVLNGPYIKYNRTRIKETKEFTNGKIEGLVEIFYPNGKIMERSNYKNNIRDGVSKWYDQEGNLSIEYTYDEGELVQETNSPEDSIQN